MSWYKTNCYTEGPFRTHSSLLQLLKREARTLFKVHSHLHKLFKVLALQHYSVSKTSVFLQTERREKVATNCRYLRSLITVTLIPPFNFIGSAGRRFFLFLPAPSLCLPLLHVRLGHALKKHLLCRLLNCWLTLKLKRTKLYIL